MKSGQRRAGCSVVTLFAAPAHTLSHGSFRHWQIQPRREPRRLEFVHLVTRQLLLRERIGGENGIEFVSPDIDRPG